MGPSHSSLSGRVAVVTGASRGAGRGIAVELGAAGATVYVTGRSTREQPARNRLDRGLPGMDAHELILTGHRTDEAHWRDRPALARTESPRYLGRAVVALAADPRVMERTGQVLRVGDLAKEYGFTDVDGRQVEAFELGAS